VLVLFGVMMVVFQTRICCTGALGLITRVLQ
jgi:hypothetical protein